MFCGKCGKELPEGTTVCEGRTNGNLPSSSFQNTDIQSTQKTNAVAIASLIVGISGFLIGFGIVAVILGIIGLNQIKASMGRQKGGGLAVAGIIIGCLGIVVLVIQIFMGVYLIPIINDLEH